MKANDLRLWRTSDSVCGFSMSGSLCAMSPALFTSCGEHCCLRSLWAMASNALCSCREKSRVLCFGVCECGLNRWWIHVRVGRLTDPGSGYRYFGLGRHPTLEDLLSDWRLGFCWCQRRGASCWLPRRWGIFCRAASQISFRRVGFLLEQKVPASFN